MLSIHHCDFTTKKAIATCLHLTPIVSYVRTFYNYNESNCPENIVSIYNTFVKTQELKDSLLHKGITSKQFLGDIAKLLKTVNSRDLSNYIHVLNNARHPGRIIDGIIERVRDNFICVCELTEDDDSDEDNGFCSMILDDVLATMTREEYELFRVLAEDSI